MRMGLKKVPKAKAPPVKKKYKKNPSLLLIVMERAGKILLCG